MSVKTKKFLIWSGVGVCGLTATTFAIMITVNNSEQNWWSYKLNSPEINVEGNATISVAPAITPDTSADNADCVLCC